MAMTAQAHNENFDRAWEKLNKLQINEWMGDFGSAAARARKQAMNELTKAAQAQDSSNEVTDWYAVGSTTSYQNYDDEEDDTPHAMLSFAASRRVFSGVRPETPFGSSISSDSPRSSTVASSVGSAFPPVEASVSSYGRAVIDFSGSCSGVSTFGASRRGSFAASNYGVSRRGSMASNFSRSMAVPRGCAESSVFDGDSNTSSRAFHKSFSSRSKVPFIGTAGTGRGLSSQGRRKPGRGGWNMALNTTYCPDELRASRLKKHMQSMFAEALKKTTEEEIDA